MGTQRGTSLVELLIALLALALFATGVQQFSRTMLRGVRVLEAAAEAQEAVRLGAQLVVADLRDAGFSPLGALDTGIRHAAPDAVALVRDLNGDGDSDDPGEAVAYRQAADRGQLQRTLGSAPPQPLLDGVPAGGFRLTYLGDDGAPLAAGTELDDGQRARIRRVIVRVGVAVPHPDPAVSAPLRAEHVSTVALRNG